MQSPLTKNKLSRGILESFTFKCVVRDPNENIPFERKLNDVKRG